MNWRTRRRPPRQRRRSGSGGRLRPRSSATPAPNRQTSPAIRRTGFKPSWNAGTSAADVQGHHHRLFAADTEVERLKAGVDPFAAISAQLTVGPTPPAKFVPGIRRDMLDPPEDVLSDKGVPKSAINITVWPRNDGCDLECNQIRIDQDDQDDPCTQWVKNRGTCSGEPPKPCGKPGCQAAQALTIMVPTSLFTAVSARCRELKPASDDDAAHAVSAAHGPFSGALVSATYNGATVVGRLGQVGDGQALKWVVISPQMTWDTAKPTGIRLITTLGCCDAESTDQLVRCPRCASTNHRHVHEGNTRRSSSRKTRPAQCSRPT